MPFLDTFGLGIAPGASTCRCRTQVIPFLYRSYGQAAARDFCQATSGPCEEHIVVFSLGRVSFSC